MLGLFGFCFLIVWFAISAFWFFKFLASFLNLIHIAMRAGHDRPRENLLTGGFGPMWRVLRHKGNSHATAALFKNLVWFLVTFGSLFGAVLLMTDTL